MKLFIPCVLVTFLLAAPTQANTPRTKIYTADQKADSLFWQFEAVSHHVRDEKRRYAIMGMSMGAALAVTGGIIAATNNEVSWHTVGYSTFAAGTGFALGAAISLAIEFPWERRAEKTFAGSESLTGQAKLDFYEKAFSRLVEEERTQRYLGSGLAIGLGVVSTVGGIALPTSPSGQPLKAILAAFGPALIIGGLTQFFLPGHFEAEWISYKANGLISRAESRPRVQIAAAPTPDGASLMAALRF